MGVHRSPHPHQIVDDDHGKHEGDREELRGKAVMQSQGHGQGSDKGGVGAGHAPGGDEIVRAKAPLLERIEHDLEQLAGQLDGNGNYEGPAERH